MTTHRPPPDPALPPLHPADPAELLAHARLTLGRAPRDSLIVLGSERPTRRLDEFAVSRSDLAPALTEQWHDHIDRHLTALMESGLGRGLALVIIGDGYEPVTSAGPGDGMLAEVEESRAMMAACVLQAARELLPEPFALEALWLVHDGAAREVILRPGADGELTLLVSPPGVLAPFEETRAAAATVLAGRSVAGQREPGPGHDVLADLLVLDAPAAGPGRVRDLDRRFEHARRGLGRLVGQVLDDPAGRGAEERFVSDCEHVEQMLVAVADDACRWELLALCVERATRTSVDRAELLTALATDPSLRPDEIIRPGGEWFQALHELRHIAARARASQDPESAEIAVEAWSGLTAVMALLLWWNRCAASAGALLDELEDHDPGSNLALLLRHLIDGSLSPAWRPAFGEADAA